MGRAPCCEKIGIKKGRWTAEEDELLCKYIEANGEGSWRSLPKNAGLKRCGKSCRLRWINYLRSDLKRGNITSEEEDTIIKMHITLGNRWSLIAGHLPGRTDNEIKNYWNSHLSRRIQTFRRPLGESPPKIIMDIVKCRRRGRTSRAAMKKNNIKNNPQKIQSIVKKVSVNKTEGEESIASGIIIPSSTALKEETLQDDKECQNTLVKGSNLGNENIGIIFNSSEEKESVRSSSLNGHSEDGLLGPYQGLEPCMLFGDDIIMSEGVLSPSGILPLNEEKQNGGGVISSLTEEGQFGLLDSSGNGIMASTEEGESGGISSSNGGAAESDEWYSSCSMTTCFEDDCWVNWDWEAAGVVESPNNNNNYKFLSNEGEELLSWLWDNTDSGKGDGEMIMECDEQNKALAAWLLS